ncbi:citrate/2-methylcitrate synthase [Acidovorax sp.]|uniref:citrate/2-methylcitrate synthase n=1 Tax=Acidovorax sp. TaxID=1872122 RepID=UPI003D001D39
MVDERLYLSADEASKALGVTVTTLYAYVSRKLIRSEKVPGEKQRRYWRADVEKLRGRVDETHEPDRGPPAVSIALSTSITLLTERGLYFRGLNALELAQSHTLEALAALLWEVEEDAAFGPDAVALPASEQLHLGGLGHLGLFERTLAALPLAERADPKSYDLSMPGFARTAAQALRWTAALVAKSVEPMPSPIHRNLAKALRAPKGFEEVIRCLLVLSADHEFDPLTYTVRSVANVGVTPFQAVMTGMIAAQGQRFQAERYGASSRFLREIMASSDGACAVIDRLRSGQPLAGFGVAGSQADPRATLMMDVLDQVLKKDASMNRLRAAQRAAFDSVGVPIDFILVSIFIGHRLGLADDSLAITGIGRTAGWLAHAMEQMQTRVMVRPRATYVGKLPRTAG